MGKYTPRLGKDKHGQVLWSHRCLARVNGRQCKCMTYGSWEHCSRHWKQRVAFLTTRKSETVEEVLRRLENSATIDSNLDVAEADYEARALTLTDYTGAQFVFSLTKVVKAKPFKRRVAERLSSQSSAEWWQE